MARRAASPRSAARTGRGSTAGRLLPLTPGPLVRLQSPQGLLPPNHTGDTMNPQINDPTQQAVIPPPPPAPGGAQFYLDPADIPNLDDVVIEDGAPVQSIFAEKRLRLL